MTNMIIKTAGDILDAKNRGTYIAHCISGDFTLGAGLARQVDNRYDMRAKLWDNFTEPEENDNYVGKALLVDNVFNLVTKAVYTDKARKKNLRKALVDMYKQCQTLGVTEVAVPKLGCGHDHMNWDKVYQILSEIFDESDIKLIIYTKRW